MLMRNLAAWQDCSSTLNDCAAVSDQLVRCRPHRKCVQIDIFVFSTQALTLAWSRCNPTGHGTRTRNLWFEWAGIPVDVLYTGSSLGLLSVIKSTRLLRLRRFWNLFAGTADHWHVDEGHPYQQLSM